MPRVVITGASGLLGGNLAAELIAAGHEVVAIRRAGTKVAHLDDLAIDVARRRARRRPTRSPRAFAGAPAVFHCAAAVSVMREVTAEMTAANVTGTAQRDRRARRARGRRAARPHLVGRRGRPVDRRPARATRPRRGTSTSVGLIDAYAITKHRPRSVVRARDRIDAVIVNPTYMFGPRDARPSSGKLIVDVVAAPRPRLDARLQQLRRRARRRARHDRGVAARPPRRALHPRRPRHDLRRRVPHDRARSPASRPPRFACRARSRGSSASGATSSRRAAASRSSTRRRSATRSPIGSGSRATRPRASSATRSARSSPRSATRSRGSARNGML